MYFFVKSELSADRVDEFTRKLANHEIPSVEGNVSYVTPDGRLGYDIVECRDENECLRKYDALVQNGLKIDEICPIEPMGQFLQEFTQREEPAA